MQTLGIAERAEVVDVLEVVEEGQPARRAARRDQQLLVGKLGAGVEPDRVSDLVELLRPGVEEQLDLLLLVPPRRAVGDRLLLDRAGQQLLGERGAA